MFDYGDDVLTGSSRHRREPRELLLRRGLVVEVLGDGFVGEVVTVRSGRLHLRDRRGRERSFGLADTGFLVDEEPVRFRLPERPTAPPTLQATASGSVPVADHRPRVARASRILVEGIHDADLLERVWGDDLRVEGIVVEVLDGVDDLGAVVAAFGPGPGRRLGVLVDHLVPGSKEARIAASVRHPHVLVTGHPFVDVWAAVRPQVIGLAAWPDVPRGEPWKEGMCRRLGEDDPGRLWRRLLAAVSGYTDLDRALVGAVEQLIDFLTEPEA
jgi:hypothetical protein